MQKRTYIPKRYNTNEEVIKCLRTAYIIAMIVPIILPNTTRHINEYLIVAIVAKLKKELTKIVVIAKSNREEKKAIMGHFRPVIEIELTNPTAVQITNR